MGFLDKLLGRGKKAAGDVTGDSSQSGEGMYQEKAGRSEERAETYGQQAQEERTEAGEHKAQEDEI